MISPNRKPHFRDAQGFTLIEVLVALALVSLAMLIGLSLLLQQPRILERVEAQRAALEQLELTLESVRARVLPVEPGTTTVSTSPLIELNVKEGRLDDLYDVTATVHYEVRGQAFNRSIETKVFRP